MATKKKSNLSLSQIKKTAKKLDVMEKYEIEDGQYKGETISFYPIFTDTRIEELLKELSAIFVEAKDKEIEITNELQIHLINLLIIKHFTHFKDTMPSELVGKDKKEGLIDYLEHFRKTGLYKLLIDEVFLPSEINKVFSNLTDFVGSSLFAMDLEKQVQDKVQQLNVKHKPQIDKIKQLGNKQIPEV